MTQAVYRLCLEVFRVLGIEPSAQNTCGSQALKTHHPFGLLESLALEDPPPPTPEIFRGQAPHPQARGLGHLFFRCILQAVREQGAQQGELRLPRTAQDAELELLGPDPIVLFLQRKAKKTR